MPSRSVLLFFFFNDTATTEIYTLSLHDALPICRAKRGRGAKPARAGRAAVADGGGVQGGAPRSEEHTSELQSQSNLVCRLLLEKKNKKPTVTAPHDDPATAPTTMPHASPPRDPT